MNRVQSKEGTVYWTRLAEAGWNLHFAATDNGLLYVGSLNRPLEEVADWVKRHFPRAELVRDDERLHLYAAQLERYLRGADEPFSLAQDLIGTPFQREVWRALEEIPYGQTESYSDIAVRIGRRSAVRAVGAAIGANPLQIIIPCHRVVGKNGALTGYRGGLEMKAQLLELERQGGGKAAADGSAAARGKAATAADDSTAARGKAAAAADGSGAARGKAAADGSAAAAAAIAAAAPPTAGGRS